MHQNDHHEEAALNEDEQKTSAIKTLAIVGFITAIVLGVWLAVQIVRLAPSGFGALASIAEVLRSRDIPFGVTLEKNVVDSGVPFTISWTAMRKEGSYTFAYDCIDGVSAEQVKDNNGRALVKCGQDFALPTDLTNASFAFKAEKKRFTDVPFTVSYTPTADADATETYKGLVTVSNPSYETTSRPAPTTTENTPTQTTTTATTTASAPVEAETPAPKPKPVSTPTPVVTTTYPVSNPNGYTDIKASYLGIGSFNESSRQFTPTAELDRSKKSAIRFEVKNIGTKTSDSWTYTVTMPDNEGTKFTSALQDPLRPNERAVVMIAFNEVATRNGSRPIAVSVKSNSDTTPANNAFTWTVKIVD